VTGSDATEQRGGRRGREKWRRALSRATSKALREPIRKIREPTRQFLLKFVPGAPVEIESAASLPLVPYEGQMPAPGMRSLVYGEARVAIRLHPLSRNSADTDSFHYVDHEVAPPGLTLEHPGPHFWFSRSGLMLSSEGGIWPHSFTGPFRPDRLRTVRCVSGAPEGAGGTGLRFHPALLKSAPRIADAHLIVAQSEAPNFGHYLLDVVPLVHLGKEIGAPMLSWPLKPWQKEILARLGVGPGRIREIPCKTHLVDHPVISNRLSGLGAHIAHPQAKRTFDTIKANVPIERHASLPRRFYLVRGQGHGRALKNRDSLVEALAARGVVAVQPELLSFDQQVALFARADLVVAEFGAALANVVFCPPGAKVVEIISEGQHDPWSSHLCAMLGLEHVVQFQALSEAERLSRGDRFAPSPDFAFTADVAAICKAVDQLG
jgi:capsular polysaccharide biosynthesis protein